MPKDIVKEQCDFFRRAAALFEQKAVMLAQVKKNDPVVTDMFNQAISDKIEAELWVTRLEAGYRLTQTE